MTGSRFNRGGLYSPLSILGVGSFEYNRSVTSVTIQPNTSISFTMDQNGHKYSPMAFRVLHKGFNGIIYCSWSTLQYVGNKSNEIELSVTDGVLKIKNLYSNESINFEYYWM